MTAKDINALLRERTLFEFALRCIRRIISNQNLKYSQKEKKIEDIMTVLNNASLQGSQKEQKIKKIMQS